MSAPVWRPWPRDHWYEVSDLGAVRSGRGVLLSAYAKKPDRPSKPHYLQVSTRLLKRNGSPSKHFAVHVMVCETFHGARPAGMQCAHIDGNAHNNCASNLAWVTAYTNNVEHRLAHGLSLGRVKRAEPGAVAL